MFSKWHPAGVVLLGVALSVSVAGCPDPNPMGAVEGVDEVKASPGAAPPTAGDPGATRPDDARFKVTPGEGVTLSGTFTYPGTKQGLMRIDLLQMPEGSPPRLVHTLELKATGEWKVSAPKGFGDLYLMAFIDQKRDGPSPDDPAAVAKVTIADQSVANVTLALSDEPDLGPFAPGGQPGAPPPDAPAPTAAQTEGTPPAEGAAPPAPAGTP